ncbi:hypothetical protein IB70_02475 [Citrobacter braakii]|nr:hypothetical protein IB70_02475 [Citrobacter braakii]
MRAKIHRYCSWIFFIVLFLFLFALYQRAYLGVTLNQIIISVLAVTGFLAWITREKHSKIK